MRLALAMCRVDWRKMLSEISPEELIEWMAYERIEPFGRPWHQMSEGAAGICNEIKYIGTALGVKSGEFFKPDAFVPKHKIPKVVDPAEGLEGLVGL